MNFPLPEVLLNRQVSRQWVPLITQQLRIRHIHQIFAYNIQTENSDDHIYFTLHQSVMSAPFYTSEKLAASANPKFSELLLSSDGSDSTLCSSTSIVLRIWLRNPMVDGMDSILLTWGVNISGLIYLGDRLTDILPEHFSSNTVIFVMQYCGYFTHQICVRTSVSAPLPFIDSLMDSINVHSTRDRTYSYRLLYYRRNKSEVRTTYSVEKLRKLRSLQLRLRNRTMDMDRLRSELTLKSGIYSTRDNSEENIAASVEGTENEELTGIRYAPQLLTMNSLNKMLQIVPTKRQKHQIKNLQKDLEVAKSTNRLLLHERDRKTAQVRKLKEQYNKVYDDYEEMNSQLMENMRQLSKEKEKLKKQKEEQVLCKELLTEQIGQLTARRRKLLLELLEIYPIVNVDNRYFINGINLPNSDALNDISDDSISVALGHVAHVLKMYEYFLQIPLRYAVTHKGSQSYIRDHITPSFIIKIRNFPLFTRGKDRVQFNYAVYLLNKNIAQLRWLDGQNTPNLKDTLSNLLELLIGRDKGDSSKTSKTTSSSKPTTESAETSAGGASKLDNQTIAARTLLGRHGQQHQKHQQASVISTSSSSGNCSSHARHSTRSAQATRSVTDASEMLAVPEAYLTRQLSERSLHRYAEQLECAKIHRALMSSPLACAKPNTVDNPDDLDNIEEGTDILASSLQPTDPEPELLKHSRPAGSSLSVMIPHKFVLGGESPPQPRLSRSVGSYSDDGQLDSVEAATGSVLSRTRHAGYAQELRDKACYRYDIGSEPTLSECVPQSDTHSMDGSVRHLVDAPSQDVYLRQWLETGPALICSEEHLYPDEVLGVPSTRDTSNSIASNAPLTARTNALLGRKTFNLVKPKHS